MSHHPSQALHVVQELVLVVPQNIPSLTFTVRTGDNSKQAVPLYSEISCSYRQDQACNFCCNAIGSLSDCEKIATILWTGCLVAMILLFLVVQGGPSQWSSSILASILEKLFFFPPVSYSGSDFLCPVLVNNQCDIIKGSLVLIFQCFIKVFILCAYTEDADLKTRYIPTIMFILVILVQGISLNK